MCSPANRTETEAVRPDGFDLLGPPLLPQSVWTPPRHRPADRQALSAYPGVGPANDPRSGLKDVVAVYRYKKFLGHPAWDGVYVAVRWVYGVAPGPPFRDPYNAGFVDLKVCRAWVAQEYPFCRDMVCRQPGDNPNVVETWV